MTAKRFFFKFILSFVKEHTYIKQWQLDLLNQNKMISSRKCKKKKQISRNGSKYAIINNFSNVNKAK